MRLTYHGPFDAVDVPLPNGGKTKVEKGKPVEFDDTFAERLLEQPDNWKKSQSKKES